MVELISGVAFQQGLLEDAEVEAAILRNEVPQVPIVSGKHMDHTREKKVQAYLARHGIPSGLTYQSMFVGIGTGTAVKEEAAKNYGIPLVVRPTLVSDLVVASLGDLQNVVCSIFDSELPGSPLDSRIVNLVAVEDPETELWELVERAKAQNRLPRATPVYIEARIYRQWTCNDFVRPCLPGDYIPASGIRNSGKKPMFRRVE